VKVHGIFGGIGSVPKRISETPLFAEAASAAAATGTTFIELCRMGTPEAVAAALRSGADVNARGEKKRTALMYAAAKNPEPGVVSALLEAGADIQGENDVGWTALMAAAHNSNPDVTATLLEAGANVHERNRSGRTALMEARENENPRARKAIVKLLKRAEAGEQPFYGSKDEKGR